jgi:hypothetical protein
VASTHNKQTVSIHRLHQPRKEEKYFFSRKLWKIVIFTSIPQQNVMISAALRLPNGELKEINCSEGDTSADRHIRQQSI